MTLVPAEGALVDQILSASFPIWNEGLTREAYARWWRAQLATSWGRANLRRVALVDGGRVLASAKRYNFAAVLDGRAVRVLGIGAVFTQPEVRGQGHARMVVEQMVETGRREGFDFALLFSEIGPAYYEQLGFEAIRTAECDLEVSEKPGAPATLVRAGEDRDLPALEAIGRDAAAPFRFHLVRGRDLIQYGIAKKRLLAGLGPHGRRELQFFVSEEGTAAVAYVVLTAEDGAWTIEECGDRDPSGARVGAILQVLLAREPAAGRPRIRARLPHGWTPPQVRRVNERAASEIMMMRALGSEPLPKLGPADLLYWQADVF